MIKTLLLIAVFVIVTLLWVSVRLDEWEETMRDAEEEK